MNGVPPLLAIERLEVDFRTEGGGRVRAVRGVDVQVGVERTVALVGESGSGKSVTAMAVPNLLPPNAERRGRIVWRGRDELIGASPDALRRLRGREIACVFQDPMSSLNPVLSIGSQLAEPLTLHLRLSRRQAHARAAELLAEVGIDSPRRRLGDYPHELSGGQQQRVMIAMALACGPRLLIADEPTTALDATVQRQILELIARLRERHRMSVLFISHDLGVVGEIADEVVVLRDGRVREAAPVRKLFADPADPYTRALLACRPRLDAPSVRLQVEGGGGCGDRSPAAPVAALRAFEPGVHASVVLEVRGLAKSYPLRARGAAAFARVWRRRQPRPALRALEPLDFSLRRGGTLGIVGESGSGKSTLALALLGLLRPDGAPATGSVRLGGQELLQRLPRQALRAARRRLQIVFQNPYASLNPRLAIADALVEPMAVHGLGRDRGERLARAGALLAQVGLDAAALGRYPHEFSGGQRQRIAIARCLAVEPEVLVLDEAVAALDARVQAQVLDLLKDLQQALGLAYLFISHDLAAVRFMADEVIVLERGRVVERGDAAVVLGQPQAPCTRALLAALPRGVAATAAP